MTKDRTHAEILDSLAPLVRRDAQLNHAARLADIARKVVEQHRNAAIGAAKQTHQQWHWDTRRTDCPWGCGDGGGMDSGWDYILPERFRG